MQESEFVTTTNRPQLGRFIGQKECTVDEVCLA
jgi:hypothetical protein